MIETGSIATCARGQLGLISSAKFVKGKVVYTGVHIDVDDFVKFGAKWESRDPTVIFTPAELTTLAKEKIACQTSS